MTARDLKRANEETREAWNQNAAFWDERMGEEHRYHVRETPALFPWLRDLGGFVKLLFSEDRGAR